MGLHLPAGFAKQYRPPSTEQVTDIKHQTMMRMSCTYFAHYMLRGPEQAPYNGRFLVAEHHEQWNELVTNHKRICVLASRDSGKTYFFDFAYPIWKAFYDPRGKGFIFSGTQDQAVRILSDIKSEIEDNDRLAHLRPNDGCVWSATSIELGNGHKIYARGFGTKVRGAHPDWIVADDVLSEDDSYSEMTRQKNIDYFLMGITPMCIPGGQIIAVGTPLAAQDLYDYLSKNSEYVFRKYPALNKGGQPLWPARYDKKRLEAIRREIGSIRFTREYLADPISDDMSLFPESLFRGAPTEQYQCTLGMPISYWKRQGIQGVFIGVDLAISSSTGADYTVVFVMGVDASGNRWVLDIVRSKGLPYQQQLSLIQGMGRRYDADLIFIESNQMQRVFGDELIRTTDLPIHKFYTTGTGSGKSLPGSDTTSQNKNSLAGGVPSLRVMLENRKLRIPRGDQRSVEVTDSWISEMRSFTWANGKLQGVGAHDDQVLSFWICEQAAKKGSFNFSTGDDDQVEGGLDALIAGQLKEPEAPKEESGEESTQAFVNRVLGSASDYAPAVERAQNSLIDEELTGTSAPAWGALSSLRR